MRLQQASLPRAALVNQQLRWNFAGALGAVWPVGWSSVQEHVGELISLSEGGWSEGRGSGEGLEWWNADVSSCVASKCGEEVCKGEGSDGCCWWCGGVGYVGGVARCQKWFSVAVRVMRKLKVIPVPTRMRNREEADRWCAFDIASIENGSCWAVKGRVPTGLFFGDSIEVDLKFVLGEGKTLESTNTDIHDSGNNMTDNYSLSCQSTDLEVLSCSYTVHVVSTSIGVPLILDGAKPGNNGSPVPSEDRKLRDLLDRFYIHFRSISQYPELQPFSLYGIYDKVARELYHYSRLLTFLGG
ncbi:uncharacterized protein [Physcomitrium patens]|uniref:uncharacterized protein isoform X3 n=1 Tax=Physcomitrium patens TaxID=3218 RepID=UPI000D17A148|nr:uncharacterized protein LOC112287043 isoform X3 [Physcomitrium patens]|eukprot:XP_024385417.1 uncharacterized protein LOC112287043 isoform X3 [Physcomitrella patens]